MERVGIVSHGTKGSAHGRRPSTYVQKLEGGMTFRREEEDDQENKMPAHEVSPLRKRGV
jgi:hypothetical protein